MRLQEIIGLIRRHLAAVLLVAVAFAAVAYSFKHAPMTYEESGTVVFTTPKSITNPNPYTSFSESLIQTAGTLALMVMSPQGQHEVRAAGGTATPSVSLVNSYNLEYPLFGSPEVTVTATSYDPVTVHRTFTVLLQLIKHDLLVQENRSRVRPVNRIGTILLADSGPLARPGSSKRVLAGLFLLAIITAFAVASFLDRHPIRLRPRRWSARVPARAAGR